MQSQAEAANQIEERASEEKTSLPVQSSANNWDSKWDDVNFEETAKENKVDEKVETVTPVVSSNDAQLNALLDQQSEELRRMHETLSEQKIFAQSLELELKSQIENSHEV